MFKDKEDDRPFRRSDVSNDVIFKSMHVKKGPLGIASFILALVTFALVGTALLAFGGAATEIYTALAAGQNDFREVQAYTWIVVVVTVLAAITWLLSILAGLVSAVEGSWWGAITLGMYLAPVIVGLIYFLGIVIYAIFNTLF